LALSFIRTSLNRSELKARIFDVDNPSAFNALALDIFRYQSVNNAVYGKFLHFLGVSSQSVQEIEDIPFLPIELFKSQQVVTGEFIPEEVFTSSGTSGAETSRHYLRELEIYRQSFTKGFELFYGPIEDYCVLALLPAYLEREGSSLVLMADDFIKKSNHPLSGFYLNNLNQLAANLKSLANQHQPTLLLGVSFALLDLAEQFPQALGNTIIMETGGMKGRRKELTRNELHQTLQFAFEVEKIHSEYGMTELLSQAYSKGDGLFNCPPWLQILIREQDDPMSYAPAGKTGGINVIDLANIDSCSFIATSDLGRKHADNSFEVLGRFDSSDVRGCNLMVG
jgi:hypothetical protein